MDFVHPQYVHLGYATWPIEPPEENLRLAWLNKSPEVQPLEAMGHLRGPEVSGIRPLGLGYRLFVGCLLIFLLFGGKGEGNQLSFFGGAGWGWGGVGVSVFAFCLGPGLNENQQIFTESM